MNWQIASRTAALSSTTRIHGVRGDGMAEETTSVSCLGQYEFVLIFVYCAEVAQAKPQHGSGAPSRCQSHKERIRALLKERGPAGVLSSELYDSPEPYGRSPRNRISELRKPDGCLIETITVDASTVRYVLLRDSDGEQPNQNPHRTESRDWYARTTGKSRAAVVPEKSITDHLPLFDVAVR
jgi:hypothetical protein